MHQVRPGQQLGGGRRQGEARVPAQQHRALTLRGVAAVTPRQLPPQRGRRHAGVGPADSAELVQVDQDLVHDIPPGVAVVDHELGQPQPLEAGQKTGSVSGGLGTQLGRPDHLH